MEEVPLRDLWSLAGQVAVVTGAGRGIGAATARRLAEAGARVIVADVDAETAAAVAEAIGESARAFATDLTSPDGPGLVAAAAVAAFAGLDIWVNNAGIYPSAAVTDLDDDEWERVVDLNLTAAFRGARAAARTMRRLGTGGVIVNVASNAGMAAGPGSAHYTSSKHGVVGLTKSLAVDLGPFGIRAVGVAPGVTRTEGLEAAMEELRGAGWGDLEEYARRTTPLGRMATPDEIARVVVFAAGGLAAYVTGTTIVVDGGQLTSFT